MPVEGAVWHGAGVVLVLRGTWVASAWRGYGVAAPWCGSRMALGWRGAGAASLRRACICTCGAFVIRRAPLDDEHGTSLGVTCAWQQQLACCTPKLQQLSSQGGPNACGIWTGPTRPTTSPKGRVQHFIPHGSPVTGPLPAVRGPRRVTVAGSVTRRATAARRSPKAQPVRDPLRNAGPHPRPGRVVAPVSTWTGDCGPCAGRSSTAVQRSGPQCMSPCHSISLPSLAPCELAVVKNEAAMHVPVRASIAHGADFVDYATKSESGSVCACGSPATWQRVHLPPQQHSALTCALGHAGQSLMALHAYAYVQAFGSNPLLNLLAMVHKQVNPYIIPQPIMPHVPEGRLA
eukprot:353933-Chlamydomonas_euryale.AAC.8